MNPISEEKLKIPYLPHETLKILNSLANADSQLGWDWMSYKYHGPNVSSLKQPDDSIELYIDWLDRVLKNLY